VTPDGESEDQNKGDSEEYCRTFHCMYYVLPTF
jgi:hypothetical protein